ncbi:hypothetical protein EW145_g3554 [Phellinidium pouzarii]|uniref:AB hydrolase-1 domain-containing protein n=1 Tax=Phellinidium pouzarii TaxID=167371 RepID=A0A4S4L716_9AGAM|nr:hypothetical protein EW145_g3554 [Phellinidium pouzarii]
MTMAAGSPDAVSHTATQGLPPLPLPKGVSSRYVPVNDLVLHFLEALPKQANVEKPALLLLLHGFPELAYSWRHLLRPLADLGYRVVAPDQRGYGRTIPSSGTDYPYTYESPLAQFSLADRVRDIVALVFALGYESAACVIGHDFGSSVAANCALIRPDVFRSLVLMSGAFTGAPDVPSSVPTLSSPVDALVASDRRVTSPTQITSLALDALFASMDPPRMHYQHYFSLPQANEHIHKDLTPDELHTFLRDAYSPRALTAWTKEEASRLPPYYLPPRSQSMPDVVNPYRPQGADLERSRAWLTDTDVAVFAQEFGRTGFQGALNRYRCLSGLGRIGDTPDSISASDEDYTAPLSLFARKKVEVPVLFIAGSMDWGPKQIPGGLAKMREVCPLMKPGDEGIVFVEDAGHWVQQEQPEEVFRALKVFLQETDE